MTSDATWLQLSGTSTPSSRNTTVPSGFLISDEVAVNLMDAYASCPASVKLRLIFIFAWTPFFSCLSQSRFAVRLPQSGRHSVRPGDETRTPFPCTSLLACTIPSFLVDRRCPNTVPVDFHNMLWPPNRPAQLAAFAMGSSTGNSHKILKAPERTSVRGFMCPHETPRIQESVNRDQPLTQSS